jgi:RNA polymerase sigma-70 factor (ECF subfamily)
MKSGANASREKHDGVTGSEAVALLPSQVATAAFALARPSPTLPETPRGENGSELSDEQLALAVRRGDRGVGRLLYGRLIRVIDSTLARVLGVGQADHDDLVQAAFEEVLRTLFNGQFKGRCKLSSWAGSIACHIGLNAIRSRKTERTVFDRAADVSDSGLRYARRGPEPMLEARDELNLLRTALATLSPGRAEAVVLHDALGYDLKEVAALTQSTEAAVQSRLVRGRRDLAERFTRLKRRRDDE